MEAAGRRRKITLPSFTFDLSFLLNPGSSPGAFSMSPRLLGADEKESKRRISNALVAGLEQWRGKPMGDGNGLENRRV